MYLAAAVSEPALYRLLTFHVPTQNVSFPLFKVAQYFLYKHSPTEPSEGVVYLWIVLSPEESYHLMSIS
jgi:hypothetical protein